MEDLAAIVAKTRRARERSEEAERRAALKVTPRKSRELNPWSGREEASVATGEDIESTRSAPETGSSHGPRRRRASRSAPARIKCQRCGVRVSAGPIAQKRHLATCRPQDEAAPSATATSSPRTSPTPEEALATVRAYLALPEDVRDSATRLLAATLS